MYTTVYNKIKLLPYLRWMNIFIKKKIIIVVLLQNLMGRFSVFFGSLQILWEYCQLRPFGACEQKIRQGQPDIPRSLLTFPNVSSVSLWREISREGLNQLARWVKCGIWHANLSGICLILKFTKERIFTMWEGISHWWSKKF